MMFWLAAGALLILALGFVAWPLLRSRAERSRSATGRRAEMRALYQDRVAELEAEAAAGQIDPESRQQVLDELGANLLEEYPDVATSASDVPANVARGVTVAVWLLLVALPVTGIAVYLTAGEPAAVELAGASRVLSLDPDADRAEIERWRARLGRRVEHEPDDGQSWYLLGVSRLQLADFRGAADAFAQAHGLLGHDPNVALYWLQSRYLASGGELDDQSRTLARQVLQARPNHPLVLEMFAIDAYRRGDYAAAVAQLNRALDNSLPPAQRAALQAGLEQARSRMGTLKPTIDVNVPAPAQALRQGPLAGVLFVIARPPGGGMPYAVVRRPAAQLPLSVRLDDTVTMSGAKLSAAEAFEVVVRISRDGTPTAAPGDLEWRSGVLHPDEIEEPLSLTASLEPRDGGET